ncbi:MAG: hypothetical protein P9L92_14600 [Candidatus Electryonea clarkiae]|nr:hypothetical protein [Candidatus Electryonea clarkiae]MDP8287506.1 hypothetical protein [Candidatus Electryonea clarkiae]
MKVVRDFAKLVTAVILVSFIFQAGCSKLEKKDSADDTMQKWAEYTAQVDDLKKKMTSAEKELFTLVGNWNEMLEEKGKSSESISLEDQEKMDSFERLSFWTYLRMKNEQEAGFLPLIDEIYSQSKQIVDLQEEVKKLSTYFETPNEVKSGDTHFQLALKYLDSREDVPEDQKTKILRKAGLWDELQVGFLIYFYYDNEELYTSVHQGKATISPTDHRRKLDAARRLIFQARADSMMTIIQEQEVLSDSLTQRIVVLDAEIQSKLGAIDSLEVLNKDLERENVQTKKKVTALNLAGNSIHYVIISEDILRSKDIYKSGFLFFKKPSFDTEQAFKQFDFKKHIDTRETSMIDETANEGKGKIEIYSEQGKKLEKDSDYTFEFVGGKLRVHLDRIDPFKGHKLIIMNR